MIPLLLDFLTLGGIWVFFSGGVLIKSASEQPFPMIELSAFGWFYLPHLLLYFFGKINLLKSTFSYTLASLTLSWLRKNLGTYPRFFPTSVFSFVGFIHAIGVVQRYRGFGSDWDLAIYANACSHDLYSSLRWEKLILADHFEPILGLFVPLCKLIDPAIALLLVQTAAWTCGSMGFYFFVAKVGFSPLRAFLFGLLYLFFPPLVQTIYLDFHMIALAIGLIPWILWAIAGNHFTWMFAFCLVYLGLKESTGLTLFALGLWLSFRGRKILGLTLSSVSIITFVVVVKIVVPYFRGGEESFYFAKLYGHLGHDMESIFFSLLTRPLYILDILFSYPRLKYLVYVFIPFLFLHFIKPVHLLIVLPALMLNLLSSDGFYHSGGFHYEAEITPWLLGTSVFILKESSWKRLYNKDVAKQWLLLVWVIYSGVGIGAHLIRYSPSDEALRMHAKLRSLTSEAEYSHKKVASIEKLATHLAGVRNLYLLDRWQEADLVVIGYPQGKRLWHLPWNHVEMEIVPELNKSMKLIYQDEINPTFRIWGR